MSYSRTRHNTMTYSRTRHNTMTYSRTRHNTMYLHCWYFFSVTVVELQQCDCWRHASAAT